MGTCKTCDDSALYFGGICEECGGDAIWSGRREEMAYCHAHPSADIASCHRKGESIECPDCRECYPTDDRIAALSTAAGEAGDLEQVRLCDSALAGDMAARGACARAIADIIGASDDGEARGWV